MSQNRPLALITGAAAGIGAEYARVFAGHGYDLILVDRDEAGQRQVADAVQQRFGVNCSVIARDLSTAEAPQSLFDEVQALGRPVDVLVNNAGILHRGQFKDVPLAAHQALIMVNCHALMSLSRLFLQAMLARGSGRILNMASLSSFQPVALLANYAASKAYVLSLTESMHMETRGTKVTVTAICPGFVNTKMIQREGHAKPMSVPLVRTLTPEEVARQGYAACMAGKVVYVNGIGNRLTNFLTGIQPGWLRRWIMIRLSRHGF